MLIVFTWGDLTPSGLVLLFISEQIRATNLIAKAVNMGSNAVVFGFPMGWGRM